MSSIFNKHHINTKITVLLQTFLSAWAVSICAGMSTRSLLTPVIWLLLILFAKHAGELSAPSENNDDLPARIVFPVLAALFSLAFVMHGQRLYTAQFSSMLFKAVTLLVVFTGLFFLFRSLLRYLNSVLRSEKIRSLVEGSVPSGRIPLITFFACVIVYLPYFLYEYPGIISPDGLNQIEQIIGAIPWSNHHPVAHTLVIGLFYRIGSLFTSDINAAVSVYTFFQMIFMAACSAAVVKTLKTIGCSPVFQLLAGAFYAFMPFCGVFAVYVLKDTFFSGIFMLFICCLLLLVMYGCTAKRLTAFFILSLALCLFRSNGWYAFLLLTPFLVLGLRREWKKILPLVLCVILLAGTLRGPVMNHAGIKKADFIESMCVPLQQISRVIYDGCPLTQEEQNLIGSVITIEHTYELYDPGFADNMKELVRAGHQDYLTDHKADFFRLWLSLGLRYPLTYVNAWLDLTKGYWFPEPMYDAATIDGVFGNSIGLTADPILRGRLIVKTKEILLKLGEFIPVYALLWTGATYTWLLLISAGLIIKNKISRKYLLVLLPSLALIATLFLATPSATEFRYELPVVMTMPLWLLLGLRQT